MATRLDARVFTLSKDPDQPSGYQDACRVDGERRVAAIADGVSSSIFSGPWASILAEAAVGDAPDPAERELFAAWLAAQRRLWAARIDTSSLAWFQRAKLPMGAFSTLLWVRVLEAQHAAAGSFGAYRLLAWAVGDSCLFQVRRGELVRSFPIRSSVEFEADPIALGSMDLKRDQLLQFAALDEFCYPEDLLVLSTDALAEWALREYESARPPAWDNYWNMPEEEWRAEIDALRHERQMREDDTTLLLLRVVEQTVSSEPAADAAPPDRLSSARQEVKSASAQVAREIDQASGRAWRGLKSLGDKAMKKYRDKFGKEEPPDRK